MKRFLPLFILLVVVLAAGCIGSENSTTTSSSMHSTGVPVETGTYTESTTNSSYTTMTGSFVLSGDIVYYYVHDSTTETVMTTGEFTFTYTQLSTINTETYLVYDDGNNNRVIIDTANDLTWIIISGAETTTTVYGSS